MKQYHSIPASLEVLVRLIDSELEIVGYTVTDDSFKLDIIQFTIIPPVQSRVWYALNS